MSKSKPTSLGVMGLRVLEQLNSVLEGGEISGINILDSSGKVTHSISKPQKKATKPSSAKKSTKAASAKKTTVASKRSQ